MAKARLESMACLTEPQFQHGARCTLAELHILITLTKKSAKPKIRLLDTDPNQTASDIPCKFKTFSDMFVISKAEYTSAFFHSSSGHPKQPYTHNPSNTIAIL